MLWYKWWLETRWRFLIGLAVVACLAAGIVLGWPKIKELMPLASSINVGGEIGRQIREAAELSREYRGYIWSQWFRQNGSQLGTLFAILLGTGGISPRSGGLFTLSLPISRNRLLATRAGIGLAELFLIALAPPFLISLLSPAVDKTYGMADALIHGACLFIAASAFFSLAFLLSSIFSDFWPPLLIALLAALIIGGLEQISPEIAHFGIFHVMSGETYFRTGELPWQGLLASIAASAALLYGANLNTGRQDF